MSLFAGLVADLPAGVEARIERLMAGPLADGLPLVPPSREALAHMLAATSRPGATVLGDMAPLMQEVTIEDAAICALAAGCEPAYFPVVLAALEALLDPAFNLLAVQATTELASPLVVVNGPIAGRLGIHSGSGCLGPGFRANATIGRALRLAAMHIGGALPGETDMATFGHGGKFSACLAEAEADTSWEPLHVARGFARAASTVTVIGADAPVNVNDFGSTSPAGLMHMIAETMTYPGSNNAQGGGEVLLVLSPAHAGVFARAGMSKRDLQAALYQRARVPLARFSEEIMLRVRRKRAPHHGDELPDPLPVADGPDEILIAVAGGPGAHTLFFPTYGETRAVTRVVSGG
ncbi:MAG: hypothetical protein IT531_06270 [Burkholderiales bacterium]|nr:hypothetical protein [Burkholderiales bacterium]